MRTRSTVVLLTMTVMLGPLTTEALGYARPGETLRVTPSEAGWDISSAALSGDGGTVAVVTAAAVDERDTNEDRDVYVRDLEDDAWERVSLTHDGRQADGHSQDIDLSHDGRFVTFESDTTNIPPNDANGRTWDIYVRDRLKDTTSLVSVSSSGVQNDGNALDAEISADGRYVVFQSTATNLVPDDTNGAADVFVRDLQNGTTERVSVAGETQARLIAAQYPTISGDGRFVGFTTRFPFSADDLNAGDDVYVFDRFTRSMQRASLASDGTEGNGSAFFPALSHDGRHVAFASSSSNVVPNDVNGSVDTFVRDLQMGVTERVSVTSDGRELNNVFSVPAISGDGRWITGNVLATNLGYEDGNANTDIYVHDRVGRTTELASRTAAGTAGDAISVSPAMSADGRTILFRSEASDLEGAEGAGNHLYLRRLGPARGIGNLSARAAEGAVEVRGWARIEPETVLSVADPSTDAGVVGRAASAELTEVSAVARPEEGDLLVSFDTAPSVRAWAPLVGTSLQRPGVTTYVLELRVGGVRHEIRAEGRIGVEGAGFGIYRCATSCEKVADLTGGIGTAGDGAVVSVPFEALGLAEGGEVEAVRGYAAASEPTTGSSRILDEVALGGAASVPRAPLVQLGFAERGTPPHQVVFAEEVAIDQGRFGTWLASPTGPQQADLWARVCFAGTCAGARQAPVAS